MAKARTQSQGASRKQAPQPERKRGVAVSVWFNRLLLLTGSTVVMVAAVQAWLHLRAIPVEHIRVTGDIENLQREQVQGLIQPALDGGFLAADLRLIRQELESLPWVYEASARRRWPNALEINVEEQLPIARWGEDGFLNHSGEVFHTSRAGDWDSLPALRGPEGSQRELMARYLRLIDLLAPLQLAVNELAIDARGQLQLKLQSGAVIVLGNSEFLERVQRFMAIYPEHLSHRADQIERVDMRYESGLAVAYKATDVEQDPARVAGI
jgi:cell division protein FtsQ